MEVKKEIITSISTVTTQFPQVSWVKEDNLHLTLKFLGNVKTKLKVKSEKLKVDQSKILEEIKRRIENSIEGTEPFELAFNNLGYFAREQLIIWLGIKESRKLAELVLKIEREMKTLGFPKEKRKFSPHITVGRGKRLSNEIRKKIIASIKETAFTKPKPFIVSEVALMQSTLTPKGPIYTSLSEFPFTS